ncbi:MAG TPA: hypothetical protein VH475_13780 [Tepidisphaeraceae bacterium]
MRLACCLILSTTLILNVARADEPNPKTRHYAAQLARQCDDLIASAVKRPYGWGWAPASEAEATPQTAPPRGAPVAVDPAATASAGLVLLHASELLDDPGLRDAAVNAARGVAAAQETSGRVPAQALFGSTSATTKEAPAALADRAPTRAAMALLLSLYDENDPRLETVNRAAPRAARWLLRQQAESGAWPILYPPGATPQRATRLVRLDTPDTRDCTLAMLLAYEVMGDPVHRRCAERSLDFLFRCRTGMGMDVGAGLWPSGCTLGAQPVAKVPELPPGVDALASRYAMQTFFAVWVVLGDGSRLAACDQASKSLDALFKGADGGYHRRFDAKGGASDVVPTTQRSLFGTSQAAGEPPATDPAVTPTIRTIAVAQKAGREAFRERLSIHFAPKQHLAQAIAGLSDGPMLLELPQNREEVEAWLKTYDQRRRLSGEAPQTADRLWLLYLRARVEKQFGV